jgi:glycosyltransferase involved in cell wall biosynthesis
MKLLVLYPYVPYPQNRGTYHRAYHLARELGRYHQVDLFCLDEGSDASRAEAFSFAGRVHFEPFAHPPWPRIFPRRLLNPTPTTMLHWSSPRAAAALKRFTLGQEYDAIHFCDLVLWQYATLLPRGPLRNMDRSRVDWLFQLEELRHLSLGTMDRLLRRENLWKLGRYERQVARHLDKTVVCGPEDAAFLRRHVPEARKVKVLANGVDDDFFSRETFPPAPDPEPTILFCGAMDYSPNIDGLKWYFEEADALVRQEIPNRRVLVVGRDPVPVVQALAAQPGVTVTGEVPDVRPYYQRSWVQMVPLRIGGGTRLKIVESLALGTPVVSTTIGAQGLDLRHDEHLLLADTPGAFAAQLALLLRDGARRVRLSEEGRRQVLARYTWKRLGRELSDDYEALLQEKRP